MPAARKIIMLIVLSSCFSGIMAQKPTTSGNRNRTAPEQAKPKFRTSLGGYNDSATISVADAEKLILLPLVVSDAKEQPQTVVSYQVLYTRLAVTEDEVTGKVSPITSIVAQRFTATPVPLSWSKFVIEQIKPGEQLYFFDIVVKDGKGKLYFVPELRIKTK